MATGTGRATTGRLAAVTVPRQPEQHWALPERSEGKSESEVPRAALGYRRQDHGYSSSRHGDRETEAEAAGKILSPTWSPTSANATGLRHHRGTASTPTLPSRRNHRDRDSSSHRDAALASPTTTHSKGHRGGVSATVTVGKVQPVSALSPGSRGSIAGSPTTSPPGAGLGNRAAALPQGTRTQAVGVRVTHRADAMAGAAGGAAITVGMAQSARRALTRFPEERSHEDVLHIIKWVRQQCAESAAVRAVLGMVEGDGGGARLGAATGPWSAVGVSEAVYLLCQQLKLLTVERGGIVFRQGDAGTSFFIVLSGGCEVWHAPMLTPQGAGGPGGGPTGAHVSGAGLGQDRIGGDASTRGGPKPGASGLSGAVVASLEERQSLLGTPVATVAAGARLGVLSALGTPRLCSVVSLGGVISKVPVAGTGARGGYPGAIDRDLLQSTLASGGDSELTTVRNTDVLQVDGAAYSRVSRRMFQRERAAVTRRLGKLRGLTLFAGWPADEVAFLCEWAREARFARGAVLYREGDSMTAGTGRGPGDHSGPGSGAAVYFLSSGAVGLSKSRAKPGRDQELADAIATGTSSHSPGSHGGPRDSGSGASAYDPLSLSTVTDMGTTQSESMSHPTIHPWTGNTAGDSFATRHATGTLRSDGSDSKGGAEGAVDDAGAEERHVHSHAHSHAHGSGPGPGVLVHLEVVPAPAHVGEAEVARKRGRRETNAVAVEDTVALLLPARIFARTIMSEVRCSLPARLRRVPSGCLRLLLYAVGLLP